MINTIQKNKITIIIVFILLLVTLFLMYNFFTKKQDFNIQSNTSFDSAKIGNNKEFNQNVQQTFKDSAKFLKQDSVVSLMLKDTPYRGTNFRIAYNYDKFKVEAIFNKNNREAAEKEFSEFLNKYGITDRNWIRNLEIREE